MLLSQSHAAASRTLVSFCLSIVACFIVAALFIKRNYSESSTLDTYRCHALLTKGRWFSDVPYPQAPAEGGRWQPVGCMLHEYTQQDIAQCLQRRAIAFVGDSTARRLFWAVAHKITPRGAQELEATAEKHSNATFEHAEARLQFVWDPYLNDSSVSKWKRLDLQQNLSWNDTSNLAVVIGSGLWYAKHMEDRYLDTYKSQVRSFTNELSPETVIVTKGASIVPSGYRFASSRKPIYLPIIQPDIVRLAENRSISFAAERLDPMNHFLEDEAASGRIELFQSFSAMTRAHSDPFESDGLHLSDYLTSIQADMMLNFLCNSQMVLQKPPYDKTCCNMAPWSQLAGYIVAVSLAILLLLMVSMKLRCVFAAFQTCKSDGSFKDLLILSLAVVYCFAADRSPLFEKINKPVNLPAFAMLLLFGSVSGLAFTSHLPTEGLPLGKNVIMPPIQRSFLSRQQSEEWKGWMQLVILLYHYFGMSKILWVYQVARLLVASYLFMTGFGHTTYFLRSKDFSIQRFVGVLLRLNMLSCILGYVMLSSYDFYYFSVLCSFWFGVVYCTLGLGFSGEINTSGIVTRCLGSILCVNCFIHIPGILETFSDAMYVLCRISFNSQEFRFRVGLDMYVVYVGILVGWLYHKRHDATFYSSLDSYLRRVGGRRWANDNERLLHSVLRSSCAALLVGYLILISCFSDKYQYNKLHPWISPIFVLAYLALRNSTKRLRETHSPLFAWLGRCSLETYILQCHIWLAGDAKGLLCLGLINRSRTGDLLESMIITLFFLWASHHVSEATGGLTAALVGAKKAMTSRGIASRVAISSATLVAVNWSLDVLSRKLSVREA